MASTSGRFSGTREGSTDGVLARAFGKITSAGVIETFAQLVAQSAQLAFLSLEQPQSRPQRLGGILVASRCDEPVDKVGLLVGKYNVSRGHVRLLMSLAIYANSDGVSTSVVRTRFQANTAVTIIDMYGSKPYIIGQRRIAMFSIDQIPPTSGKMEARKELRLHRADEERIKAAAAAVGLQEADFIRQAALLRAQEVEQRLSLSVLPVATFEAFRAAVESPGRVIPGLAAAVTASGSLLKNAD
jgi:uncharacterized protein (DUF1778 family)